MYKKMLAALVGLLLFVVGSWLNYYLLTHDLVSSGDFVTLELAVLIASLLIAFLSNISEISSASFVIKLREVQAEAQVTMRQLENLLVAAFEPQLEAARNGSGALSDLRVTQDPRIQGFISLLGSIERAKLTSQLAAKISETAQILASAQLKRIDFFLGNEGAFDGFSQLPTAEQIRSIARASDNLKRIADLLSISLEGLEHKIESAINCYEGLYQMAIKGPEARHIAQPG